MATRPPLSLMRKDEPPEALSEVINTARSTLGNEFEISERLDAKSRALVTLAGQWFAVAQAVSAVAYATKNPHDWMLYVVAGLAALGAIALGVTFAFAWKVWQVRDEQALSPQGLLEMKTSALEDADAMSLLVDHYASLLQSRRGTNKTRTKALAATQLIWFPAMAIPLVQVGFALATRLFA